MSYLDAHSSGILRVAATTNPQSLASAIYKTATRPEHRNRVTIRAAGPDAVCCMLKAAIIANGHARQRSKMFYFQPSFDTATGQDNAEITVIVLKALLVEETTLAHIGESP